ncbi:hypothetical protein HY29_18025 [Hyphomonas beringensis]|uniref:Uncharacterized protein n=1 Tax=Hyphomonas beringensis TaxID=1280946 RepID=A0A062U6X1_9PROT|nr:hypothetical protein HY29_18025 [Hyphomonas beringensis]
MLSIRNYHWRSLLLAISVWLAFPFLANAQVLTLIQDDPSDWLLENYINDNVVLWYTPSNCASGALNLPAGTSNEDRDRFWSLMLSAKLSGSEVQIYYYRYDDARSCIISSFGMQAQ